MKDDFYKSERWAKALLWINSTFDIVMEFTFVLLLSFVLFGELMYRGLGFFVWYTMTLWKSEIGNSIKLLIAFGGNLSRFWFSK